VSDVVAPAVARRWVTIRRGDLWLAALLIPVMVGLVVILMPVNDYAYAHAFFFDPQESGEVQQARVATLTARCTSGVIVGQFISLLVGILHGRRRRWSALAAAGLVAVVLAVTTVCVSVPLGVSSVHDDATRPPTPVGLIAVEAIAYPLWAAAGVGFGALLARGWLRRQRSGALAITVLFWWLTAGVGWLQYDHFQLPQWMIWPFPAMAANTAITRAGVESDHGIGPALALLGSLTIYIGLLYWLGTRGDRPELGGRRPGASAFVTDP